MICLTVALCFCVDLAAQKLQEFLKNCKLPSKFLLPFNPRVFAGKILVSLADAQCLSRVGFAHFGGLNFAERGTCSIDIRI